MKVLRKYNICPNCGHAVFSSRCKWCNSMMTDEKTVDRVEFQTQEPVAKEPPKQKIVEIISEEKPETPATVTMIQTANRWQREWQDTDSGEQTARDILSRAKEKAEEKASEIMAAAREKADQILRDAEKISIEVADTIVAEAESKSNEIINDGRRRAEEILSESKKAAAEVRNKANVEAVEQADGVLTQAKEKADEVATQAKGKADQIIQEAREVANDIVMLNKPENAENKIKGRDLVISASLILIGVVLAISAYLYVKFHM